MLTSLPARSSAPSAQPLSALLSQSNDDFYGQLQAVMNTLPAESTPKATSAVRVITSDVSGK